jgi:hypothetical protein
MSPDNNIDINTAEIKELKRRVEMSVNREMMTPKDFIFLADYLFEQINESISESTLKRIWGYNSGYKIVRRHTLDVFRMRPPFSCGRRNTPPVFLHVGAQKKVLRSET